MDISQKTGVGDGTQYRPQYQQLAERQKGLC
jgi:hypothetical protein